MSLGARVTLALITNSTVFLHVFSKTSRCKPSCSPAAAGLRSRPLGQKSEIVRQVEHHVWPLVEAGKVKPIIHTVMPLSDVAKAHTLMESSAHIGKILLTV